MISPSPEEKSFLRMIYELAEKPKIKFETSGLSVQLFYNPSKLESHRSGFFIEECTTRVTSKESPRYRYKNTKFRKNSLY